MRPADPARVVAAARGWLGTPYHDQASRRGVGCDCLGLVRGVGREVVGVEPLPVPPYSRDWGEVGRVEVLHEATARVMLPAEPSRLEPGMLLLFRMRRGAIAKHVGIVTEIGPAPRFLHSYERLGVIEEPLTETWRRRIAFVHQFPRSLSSALYVFRSGPCPEDALVRYELEGITEGHDDAAHVIDILPFAPV